MNNTGTFIDKNKKIDIKMKHFYLTSFLLLFTGIIKAQTSFGEEFSKIKAELIDWDQIRGEWLGTAIVAIAERKTVPDRTFPEELTPYHMLTMVPVEKRQEISTILNQTRSYRNPLFSNQWQTADLIINHSFCSTVTGRSYGDPHLSSFDKATYSFQTVGEFVVSKSSNNNFEVQSRQSPQSNTFSLNTAIAMNVGGDRLCYYANEKPDNNFSSWRLEGQPLQLNGRTYFLPHGGTISLVGRYYTIAWPTGESVILESRSSEFSFVNLTIQIFSCDQGNFEGLLGNANGIMEDDFSGRNNNRQRPAYASFSSFGNPMLQQASVAAEREYLNFLSRDFADDWRVTEQTSLFDYGIGQSTFTFTDRSFPKEHYTVSDLPNDKQANARKKCQEMGVSADEMQGCIFDNGFLNLNPNPIPRPINPTHGITMTKLDRPIINNNAKSFYENLNLSSPNNGAVPLAKPDNGVNIIKPIEEKPMHINNNLEENSNPIEHPKGKFEISKPKTDLKVNQTSPAPKPSNPAPSNPIQKPNLGGGLKVIKG